MEENTKNKKESNSEMMPFIISNFSNLQYIKVVFIDKNDKLCEIQANTNIIDNDMIKLYISKDEKFDLKCPTGVMLKFITKKAIHFAKTILVGIEDDCYELIFLLKMPNKSIQQQNRKFYRINTSRPCVLLLNSDGSNAQTYIAQSVNISKGGVLLGDIESLLSDKKRKLELSEKCHCHITMFLKHNLKIKSYAKFIRAECINDSYRYAFQFIDMAPTYLKALDTYITQEELKLLKV